MTQLIHEPVNADANGRSPPAPGVVFVPCAICRAPVDLAVVSEANDAPICGKHFVTELPPR